MNIESIKPSLTTVLQKAQKHAKRIGRPVLAATRITIPHLDLISTFSKYASKTNTSLWLKENDHSMLGIGTAYECNSLGKKRFSSVASEWTSITTEAIVENNACPVALGGFRFDVTRPKSKLWQHFPDGGLTAPIFTIACEAHSCELTIAEMVTPDLDIAKRTEELCSLGSKIFEDDDELETYDDEFFTINEANDAKQQWGSFVQRALETISDSSVEKIVGARTLHVTSASSICAANVLRKLHKDNPSARVFAFGRYNSYFVGATPEILFNAHSGQFKTMALAGSAPRSTDPKEDELLGQKLMACGKERLEHDYVVRTVLKALEPLCSQLHVDTAPSLHKLPKLQHLVTHFCGTIHTEHSLLEIIDRLHPTPAVGGLPLSPALKFLRTHENFDRGWYASPIGWLDADGNGEFMVALRSGLINEQHATLFAGCGLVAGSNSEQEFRETQLKFTTMLDSFDPFPTKLAAS